MPSADVSPSPTCQPDDARRFEHTLALTQEAAAAMDGVWVFGYASLIWRPEFEAAEVRAAQLPGWHRALRMRSRINRGTPDQPGLVFALFQGGTCRGMAYRLKPERVREDLERLWAREMPIATYEPRWLSCRTAEGTVRALTFTLHRGHPSCTGTLDDQAMLHVLRHARGRYGSTLDYLVQTHRGLMDAGIRDAQIERLVALACHHGLACATVLGHKCNRGPEAAAARYFDMRLDASTA